MRKFVQTLSVILAIALGAFACSKSVGGSGEIGLETFEAAWTQVDKTYYDASFGGLDWNAVGERYRAKVKQAKGMDEVRSLIRQMLFELGESHLALLSAARDEAGLEKAWANGWAGVDLCFQGDRLVFYRLDESAAAYKAGMRNGDVLVSVDGKKLKQFRKSARESGMPSHTVEFTVLASVLSQFRGRVGDTLSVVVKRPGSGKRTIDIELERYEGRMTEPVGHIVEMPLELELELLEKDVAYIRFNLWFTAVMPEIRQFFKELPEGAPGLVIDLRGNPGGMMLMAGGIAGLLLDEQASLGRTTLREGHMNVVGFPQKDRFSGPVAVIVDEASVSTSEVFAIGMQELGRVRVFGQSTPGAALPSVITSLPSGDYLQIALGDFQTPEGQSLEGHGVVPDEIVSISPVDLSEGRDTVLEAALSWIHQTQ